MYDYLYAIVRVIGKERSVYQHRLGITLKGSQNPSKHLINIVRSY